MKSIIQDTKECYLCGRSDSLESHHAIHGTANRKLADQDGLTVWLCIDCHTNLHQRGWHDKELKQVAQTAWERAYGAREEFIKRYGKSYK